jgi:hypothetical protein
VSVEQQHTVIVSGESKLQQEVVCQGPMFSDVKGAEAGPRISMTQVAGKTISLQCGRQSCDSCEGSEDTSAGQGVCSAAGEKKS